MIADQLSAPEHMYQAKHDRQEDNLCVAAIEWMWRQGSNVVLANT